MKHEANEIKWPVLSGILLQLSTIINSGRFAFAGEAKIGPSLLPCSLVALTLLQVVQGYNPWRARGGRFFEEIRGSPWKNRYLFLHTIKKIMVHQEQVGGGNINPSFFTVVPTGRGTVVLM